MSKSKTPTAETVQRSYMEELMEFDLRKLGPQGATINRNVVAVFDQMREQAALDMWQDMQDRRKFERDRRAFEEQQERERMAKIRAQQVNLDDPETQKMMEGLMTPEGMRALAEMEPEARQQFMLMAQMVSKSGTRGMDPLTLILLMDRNKPQQNLNLAELITLMKTSETEAQKNMISLMEVLKPEKSDQPNMLELLKTAKEVLGDGDSDMKEVRQALIMKALEKNETGSLSSAVKEINDVLGAFGGGGQTEIDLEISKMQANTALQQMQFQMQMRQWEKEQELETSRMEALSGIATAALASAGPFLAGQVQAAAQGVAKRAGGQQHLPPQQSSQDILANIRCTKCNGMFNVKVPAGSPPPDIVQCAHCGEELEVDLSGVFRQ